MKDIWNEKGKKIRRILLLKIDQELKSGINKNIMINSQNICELNKSYNSYKILLSVNTEVYSNYVEFFETNSFPNRKKQIKLPKHDSPKKKLKLDNQKEFEESERKKFERIKAKIQQLFSVLMGCLILYLGDTY